MRNSSDKDTTEKSCLRRPSCILQYEGFNKFKDIDPGISMMEKVDLMHGATVRVQIDQMADKDSVLEALSEIMDEINEDFGLVEMGKHYHKMEHLINQRHQLMLDEIEDAANCIKAAERIKDNPIINEGEAMKDQENSTNSSIGHICLDCLVSAPDPWKNFLDKGTWRNGWHGGREKIDPGVVFFVNALETLGAKTIASCEGHPEGFYILFLSDYSLALQIKEAGYFHISISGDGKWRLELSESSYKNDDGTQFDYCKRDNLLTSAAKKWQSFLLAVEE